MDAREGIFAGLYEAIRGRKRPLLIGINGAYTSGKTVFTEGLAQYLLAQGVKVQVIHYDDFHHPFSAIAYTDDTEVDAFYNHAFDPGKLEAEILRPLKAQGCLHETVCCVDLNTNQFTNTIRFDIDDQTIVLLEGVLLFRQPLLPYLDYRVYLDISPQEMLRRARQRDVPRFGEWILEKFATRYGSVQERYLAECDPVRASDMVIDNNDPRAPRVLRGP